MASSKMTLIGMYNWDDTIFSELLLPTGIDKDLFINSLLLQGGEFEVLYPDPQFMKNAIKIWGMKWFRTFSEWYKGTQAEWNPIYNYDRYEDARDDGYRNYSSTNTADYTDKRTAALQDKHVTDYMEEKKIDLQDKRTADLTDERTVDLKDSQTKDLQDKNTFGNTDTTSQIKKSETEHQVAAYDSSTYQPSSKDIIDNGDSKVDHTGTVTVNSTGTDDTEHTGTDTNKTSGTDTMNKTGTESADTRGSDTMDHTGTDTMNHSGTLSDIEGKDNNTNVRKAHMYGNIGVTTSAAMLKEFYDIAQWNLYEHMSDVFTSELLIPVY